MSIRYIKKAAVFCLAVALAVSGVACNFHNSKKDKAGEATTEVKEAKPDYLKKGVYVPDDFEYMVYPMEAVLLEYYSMKLPYYTPDSPDDEADSFWFSMAVLTSQMDPILKDRAVARDKHYIYISEDTMNMYVSAMYDSFGRGDLEFPEVDEDTIFAVYDDEKEVYGFRAGLIEDLEPYITDCKKSGKGYALTMQLKNKDSGDIVASSNMFLVPTSYEGEDNVFSYSIKKFKPFDGDKAPETTEEDEDSDEEDTEDKEDSEDEPSMISEEEALEKAVEYYGEDAEYSFKKIEHIGEYDYYDFSVEGEGIPFPDVLVSTDGENVMGGRRNNDEEKSWTFDQ